MPNVVRVFDNADDLDPELFACELCFRLWPSYQAARMCCNEFRE